MCVIDNARLENRESSNGRKIARMARILTIFRPKKSQRRDLFFQKCLKERRNEEADKDFENFAKIFEKFEIFTERPLSIDYIKPPYQ